MTTTATQQVALDNALVPLEKRVEIGKCNMRIDLQRLRKNPPIKLSWVLLHSPLAIPLSLSLQTFQRYICNSFEIFQICPRLPNQDFDELPSDEEIVSFIKELGHKRDIKSITEVVVDHMYQPWRTFATIINKCLSGKITGLDKLRLLRAQILWGMMTNQQMRDSIAYKTYLAYANGVTSPKMKRKFKKPASPSKKRTLVTVEEEEPEPAKKVIPSKKPAAKRQSAGVRIRETPGVSMSKKKAPAKAKRSKGIELLSDTALLEEAQLKKAIKQSRRETNIHQVGGSSEGANLESEIADEPKGKSSDTSEGTGLKPRVPDVFKADSSESEYESWGDSGDEANEKGDDEDVLESDDDHEQADDKQTEFDNPRTSDDEEETQDDEYVHTLEDYVPTDDETNDETNDSADNQVKDNTQATQKTEVPLPSSSISSDYAAKFLNFDNIPSADTKVVSMLDIKVQHEVPRTSPLLSIPVSVIPEHNVINPPETVTIASTINFSSLLTSLFPHLQQSTPIPTPTTTEAITSTTAVPDSETLTALHQRIADLEKDVKELKDIDNSTKVISTIQSEVLKSVKEYLGSSLDDAMYKVIQRNFADIIKEHSVPDEIVKRLGQQYAPQKSIEDIRKIKIEHARKQQEPKETITLSNTTALEEFDQNTTLFETMTKSKSFNKSSKQRALYHALMESILKDEDAMDEGLLIKIGREEKETVTADKDEGPLPLDQTEEETVFEAGDTQRPQNLGENTGNTDEPPIVNVDPKDRFKKPERPPTPDPKWNKCTCRSYVELDYNMEECYKALTDQLDWNNPERGSTNRTYTTSLTKTKAVKYDLPGIEDMVPNLVSKHDVYSTKRILVVTHVKVKEWYGYGHLEEIEVRRSDQQLYKFMEGDFP
ncbi:hypothetical protein Tco_0909757 [Tanacetum coccineum]|uniref:Uncharacterized protein n=1 Tax=Tanacetum coccineum TaxID=301880 RepID=A0ABQ5CSU5_9ASTR